MVRREILRRAFSWRGRVEGHPSLRAGQGNYLKKQARPESD